MARMHGNVSDFAADARSTPQWCGICTRGGFWLVSQTEAELSLISARGEELWARLRGLKIPMEEEAMERWREELRYGWKVQ